MSHSTPKTQSAKNNGVDLLRTERTQNKWNQYSWDSDDLIYPGLWRVKMAKAFAPMPQSLIDSFKEKAISFIKEGNYAHITLKVVFETLRVALEKFPTNEFGLQWISQATTYSQFQRSKGSILNFFMHWESLDKENINIEIVRFIKNSASWKVESKNVLSDDPEKSWLSDEEYEALLRTTWQNYDCGRTGTQVTLIRLLSMQYARRPIQIANLKISDIRDSKKTDGLAVKCKIIDFPGAKDRKSEQSYRDSKIESHPIADHMWKLCELHLNEVRSLYEQTLGIQLTNFQFQQLPLFCSEVRIFEAKKILEQQQKLKIESELSNQLFHLKAQTITRILSWTENNPSCSYGMEGLKRSLRPITPTSHRTGRPLIVTATRMRHTRARQLARQGLPMHILSHWLGHTSGMSIDAYYNDPAEEARKLDEALAPALTPLAMAFTGSLIDSEDKASRALDPNSKLEFADKGKLKSVGSCGKHSFCATTSIPVPCYRCKHFEPLVYAPHEEVYQALLQRQDAENNLLIIGGQRNLLIPIDLSSDIRAVKSCIERCNFRKAELERHHQS